MTLITIIFGLIFGAFVSVLLNRLQVRFNIIWVTALGISLGAWVGVILLSSQLPQVYSLQIWNEIPGLFGGPNWLILDEYSWPLVFSLVTICFAAILTSLVRDPMINWGGLAGILGITGVGLAAASAGSITSLLFAWMAIDSFELILQVSNTADRQISERIVVSISARVFGSLLVLFAVATSQLSGFNLVEIPPSINLVLILAVGFRLGVLPIQPPLVADLVPRRGVQAIVRLAPVAGALPLLARSAEIGLPEVWKMPILIFVLSAGLYGAVYWLRSPNEISGNAYWIIGAASMAVLGVVFNLPEVVNAWGISLVLGGGLLFLREASGSRLLWMYSIAVLLMLGVVFTPSWPMARLIAENLFPWGPVIVLVSGMLVFGYLKHAINQSEEVRSHVIGVHLLYVAGLSLVLTSMVFSGLSKLVWGQNLSGESWPGIIMVGVVVVMMLINRRLVNASTDRIKTIFNLLSVTVIYRFVWRIYRLSSQGVMFISRVLEGQSAVLWAVLLLAFLIAIFNQLGIGG